MENTWIVVGAYHNEIEALLAKGTLENANIDCRARLSDAGNALLAGMGMQNGPTELMVKEKDVEKARALLNPEQ